MLPSGLARLQFTCKLTETDLNYAWSCMLAYCCTTCSKTNIFLCFKVFKGHSILCITLSFTPGSVDSSLHNTVIGYFDQDKIFPAKQNMRHQHWFSQTKVHVSKCSKGMCPSIFRKPYDSWSRFKIYLWKSIYLKQPVSFDILWNCLNIQ